MIYSVAALLFVGLTTVYAQVPTSNPNPNQAPELVVVKKIYANNQKQGRIQLPVPVPYNQQFAYNQQYFAQQGPYVQVPVGPSPAPIPVARFGVPPNPPVFPPNAVKPQPQVFNPVPPQVKTGVPDKDAQIVSEARNVDFDGNFQYNYETSNGIAAQAKGYLKNPNAPNENAIQVIEGSYSSYTPEGVPVVISYIADENGFRASGDAIPTPPPIPEAIARVLPILQAQPQQPDEQ